MSETVQSAPDPPRIRFVDDCGNVTVLVVGLWPSIGLRELHSLFVVNGLEPPVGAMFGESSSNGSRFAICVLCSPEERQKATAMQTLVTTAGNGYRPRVIKSNQMFHIPLHMCEALLNLYLPLRWSHQVQLRVNENQGVVVTVRLFVDGKLVHCNVATIPNHNNENELVEVSVKKGVGMTLLKAFEDCELILPHNGSGARLMKKV